MAEKAQQTIHKNMEELVADLDKTYLRDMQKAMHLCSARCCDDKSSSIDNVRNCVDKCGHPMQQAQTYMQNELSQFQERLQRCVLDCQDRIKDKLNSETNEAQVNVFKGEFEVCALKCVDEHVKLLPSYKKRISDMLSKTKR